MSLGLQLTGTIRSQLVDEPAAALRVVERWFRENCESTLRDIRWTGDDESPALIVDLHPAAEALRMVLQGSNTVVVSAQTSAGGPGYHIFVCDQLVRVARALDIDWAAEADDGDETGYFGTGEPNLVYQEMLAWLGKLCEVMLGASSTEDANLAVAMPVGVTFEAGEFFVTQMGPRSRAWVELVSREPERGKDYFAWWNPEQDAEYYRNRALCVMWTDVRWRAPILENETQVLREVVSNLQLAHNLDPAIECPNDEWNEILDHLGIEARAPTLRTPQARSARRIGYRRNMVRVALVAGWTIQIPGAFAVTWEEDTWCGWDSEVTVWFTAFKSAVDGSPAPASKLLGEFEPDSDDVISYESGELAGKGSISFVQEENYWRLRARSAGAGRFCLCTICFKDLAQRQLALQIWQSVAL